ncbi:GntR family transcriptional regulator [Solicola gregarius]|uniref:GntR family transcriptional regulator n=1 Tax=Solicola gregarius TaxID=2908642 RepID=A0AA46YJ30_9ACTN|nr:GntR family transcriptional regulator [Solicola gregarius]UYM03777.1 GntR family transcriptional regulator [Solicola gregarius]
MPSTRRHLEPVVRESTPSIIAAKLRDAIRGGELPAGAQLGEAELARELGVSRGPLREGMQRLTQEGLLVSIPNRGLFVVEMTEADVRDMYVARSAVERAAAAQVFDHDPTKTAGDLRKIADRMSAASDRERSDQVGESDLDFHDCLVAGAHSPRLSRMHDTLLTETRMCINALGSTYPAPDIRVPEHQAIADAFAADDPALVDRLLVAHMDDAVERLSTVVPRGEE